jgi:hypothetical protein
MPKYRTKHEQYKLFRRQLAELQISIKDQLFYKTFWKEHYQTGSEPSLLKQIIRTREFLLENEIYRMQVYEQMKSAIAEHLAETSTFSGGDSPSADLTTTIGEVQDVDSCSISDVSTLNYSVFTYDGTFKTVMKDVNGAVKTVELMSNSSINI